MSRRELRNAARSLGVLAMLVLAPTAAPAQSSVQGVPNAVQGFSTNRDQPIQIEATTLEVRDKESVATFSGNVHVIQGDTEMRSKSLVVFYDQSGGKNPKAPKAKTPGPAGQQQIRRLEAKGGVVVTQKDQTASGDTGVFETRTNSVTLIGNVVITQGQNVLKGDRLVVDLDTGVSRMESDKGRVQGLFQSGPPAALGPPGRESQKPALPQPGLPRARLN